MNRTGGTNAGIGLVWIACCLSGCGGNGGSPGSPAGLPSLRAGVARNAPGLGKILTTKDRGQIYGFDVNQRGTDGILASAADTSKPGVFTVSVETFDQRTGRITSSFARSTGSRNSYAVDGIVAGDVALVTHYIVPKGSIYATRKYETLDPVTGHKFTGKWTPPVADVDVRELAENQTTNTSVAFAIELKRQDDPVMFVSNVRANTFAKKIVLDPQLFSLADGPQLGHYVAANEAAFALSPDAGAVGGSPPVNVLFDLKTGKSRQFNGYNNGYYHAGSVNGMAVDPNTGIAATDTELNAQVEFYDLNSMEGIAAVQLPCTGPTSQTNSGAGIAVDPVNKLFLVTEPSYCNGSQGSALIVYDESGNFVEAITGFKFAIGEPAVAVNPSLRMGWAFGPAFNQLQQFFY
ncbi:MAG TPA: hypothetical protein VJP76_02960 [Candidatus Tumulicola sp.]|nr:hypothetical protein [Candidatus Tumulicola sp.]